VAPPISTWVATPAEARAAVRDAKAAGYEKIKAYSFLDRASYDAIIATARELGMDVIGHVPMPLSLDDVLAAGQKLIAHSEELAKHVDGDYSQARADAIAGKMAARGVWMTPTLATTRAILETLDRPTARLPVRKRRGSGIHWRPTSGRSSSRSCTGRFPARHARTCGARSRDSRSR